MQLRNYQTEIITRTHHSMKCHHRHPLVCSPTGSGKTVIFAWLARQTQLKGKTVWFVVHRKELLDQTFDTFNKFDIPVDKIHIGMVYSFANHPERYGKPDLIIYDEAHHSAAGTWQKVINQNPDAFMIGLTATPCRLDGKPLGDIFDDLIVGITPKELINQGYLSSYRYFAPSVADLSNLNKKGSDYDLEQADEILNQRAVFGDVIHHWHKYADNLQTICYCSSIKHSISTAEAFQADGINAVHFDGNTPKDDRTEIIKRFRCGEIKILCNVDLIGEGFDVPDCWCCVLLRPTTSLGLFVQQAGRSLRPQPGKVAIILDHVGNYTRHGLPDDDRTWSLDTPIKPENRFTEEGMLKIKQCLSCYFTFPAGPSVCPNCGAEIATTREEIQQIESIRLEEIKQRREQHVEEYKANAAEKIRGHELKDCRNLTEVMAWCKQNGKRSGFGYMYAKREGMVH